MVTMLLLGRMATAGRRKSLEAILLSLYCVLRGKESCQLTSLWFFFLSFL